LDLLSINSESWFPHVSTRHSKEHVNPVKTNLVDFSKSSERAPPPKKQNTVLLKCWENHPNSKAKKNMNPEWVLLIIEAF
jgi:hypothetical protein